MCITYDSNNNNSYNNVYKYSNSCMDYVYVIYIRLLKNSKKNIILMYNINYRGKHAFLLYSIVYVILE